MNNKVETLKSQLLKLYEFGFTTREMSEVTGREIKNVRCRVHQLFLQGCIPSGKLSRNVNERKILGSIEGSTIKALWNESPEFHDWLKKSIPEGVTMAEFLVSVAVDTYNEENNQ